MCRQHGISPCGVLFYQILNVDVVHWWSDSRTLETLASCLEVSPSKPDGGWVWQEIAARLLMRNHHRNFPQFLTRRSERTSPHQQGANHRGDQSVTLLNKTVIVYGVFSWFRITLICWIQKSHWFCSIRSTFWAKIHVWGFLHGWVFSHQMMHIYFMLLAINSNKK